MSTVSRQLAELEAERDNAVSRVRQLQKAVAESEEGACDPLAPCSALCALSSRGGTCGIGLNSSCVPALATVT